jgi:hypothetical protein
MLAGNVQGLLLCWYLSSSSPELKPNKITDDEVKNKSSIELHQTEALLTEQKEKDFFKAMLDQLF